MITRTKIAIRTVLLYEIASTGEGVAAICRARVVVRALDGYVQTTAVKGPADVGGTWIRVIAVFWFNKTLARLLNQSRCTTEITLRWSARIEHVPTFVFQTPVDGCWIVVVAIFGGVETASVARVAFPRRAFDVPTGPSLVYTDTVDT